MPKASDRPSSASIESSLRRDFVAGVSWPIGRASLSALVDMGLSDDAIAHYFAVTTEAVAALRARYRVAGGG